MKDGKSLNIWIEENHKFETENPPLRVDENGEQQVIKL